MKIKPLTLCYVAFNYAQIDVRKNPPLLRKIIKKWRKDNKNWNHRNFTWKTSNLGENHGHQRKPLCYCHKKEKKKKVSLPT